MSEPKLISPLLDGFVMGDPISDHDGVRCCPAMQTDTNDKYIVKIISVPASQTKLDALLLAGAFRDSESALDYFRDLAEGVVEEAVLLQRLSRLEGFIPYKSWQVVPMEDGEIGYDVYLSGNYHVTLDRQLRHESMTHLAAVNLGLDLCAALAVCRRSGYLYVDLKPDNVVISEDQEYRIADLGFVSLSSLEYASLPERYLSAYTAPEITDAYSALNSTMDVYSVGLILYQVYNGGVLPFEGRAPETPLSAPQYADSEMAQIILKACDPNPEVRWQDPMQMGQALVNYLQSHSVNATPITVPAQPQMPEELLDDPAPEAEESEPSTHEILAEVDEALEAVGVLPEEAEIAEESEVVEEDTDESTEESEAVEEDTEEFTEESEVVEEDTEEAAGESEVVEEATEEAAEESEVVEEATEEAAEESTAEEESETAEEEDAPADYTSEAATIQEELGVTEEVSHILAQAEDLIAHEPPEPVVVPEPIDVPIPAPIVEEPEPEPEETEQAPEETSAPEEADEESPTDEEAWDEPAPALPRKKRRGWIGALVALAIVAVLAFGAYLYYQNIYLQPVLGISLNGSEDRLTVSLNTEIADELLTVYCTDTYGNTRKQGVIKGEAFFEGLNPDTRYQIEVQISGFHKLIGVTSGVHITAKQTSIAGISAVTGSENGTVILNFTVQGPETGEWKVLYHTEGEEEKSMVFTGHMVTVTGLTVGKEYVFRLEPTAPLYIVGTDTITYTASNLVFAENLQILGFQNSALTATWTAPEGTQVESWVVRCYNSMGYDKTITVSETKAVFENLDVSSAYTVEVNAAGMTQGTRTYVSANSVTVPSIEVDASSRNALEISWNFEGTAPANGWLLMYTVNGSAQQFVISSPTNSVTLTPQIPGCQYSFTVQTADGNTVFGGTGTYEAPAAEVFSGYLLSASDMSFRMCKTPENPEWTQHDVPEEDYKTTFAVGEQASFAVRLNHEYNTSPDEIVTLFVIRDSDGNIVSNETQQRTWTSMWYRGFGRINIPVMPSAPGTYTLDIYFNGASVTTQTFTVI